MLLEGERMGSATKVQRPKVVAYAWVGVGVGEAAVPWGQTFVVVGMPA
jgi:hypothetical protein